MSLVALVKRAIANVDLTDVARRNSSATNSVTDLAIRRPPIRKYSMDDSFRIGPEEVAGSGGSQVITDMRSQHDQLVARTRMRARRATAKQERARERVASQEKVRNELASQDESIPVTEPVPLRSNNMAHSLDFVRVENFNDSVRGTVTPPQRFGISRDVYEANVDLRSSQTSLSPFAEGSALERGYVETLDSRPGASSDILGIPKENMHALGRANERIVEAQETGSVVGLLRRQNELSAGGETIPRAGTPEGLEYGLLENEIVKMKRNAFDSFRGELGPGGYGPRTAPGNQEAFRRLFDEDYYNEALHARANLTTANEVITEGVTSGTPVASSGGTGMLTPVTVQPSNRIMAALEGRGFAGMGASIGMGAVLGGTANYAMGGEFSEGAMMGGLVGGGIAIGARAVAANRESISGFLQRQVLGADATAGRTLQQNANAIVNMSKEEIGNLGLTQRAARGMLMQNPASPGLQSRHMVIGGSMLAGVAFTGRRNDRRRGFNAHRGNRI